LNKKIRKLEKIKKKLDFNIGIQNTLILSSFTFI